MNQTQLNEMFNNTVAARRAAQEKCRFHVNHGQGG